MFSKLNSRCKKSSSGQNSTAPRLHYTNKYRQ